MEGYSGTFMGGTLVPSWEGTLVPSWEVLWYLRGTYSGSHGRVLWNHLLHSEEGSLVWKYLSPFS